MRKSLPGKSKNFADLIGWETLSSIPVPIVIPKSVNPARLEENSQAANLELGNQEMADLAKLDIGYRYVDEEFWTIEGSPYTLAGL